MAVNPLKYSNLVKDDGGIDKAIADVDRFERAYIDAINKIKQQAQSLKNEAKGLSPSSEKDQQQIAKLTSQMEKLQKQYDKNKKSLNDVHQVQKEMRKLDEAVDKAQAQKIAAYSKENKTLQQLRHEKNKINKTIRDEIKQAERNSNAYTKLSDESRELKNRSKRLGAELISLKNAGKDSGAAWDRLEKEYRDVTKQAITTDKQLKKLDKTVGDNYRSVGNYENATRKLTSGLKMLAGAAGLGALVGGLGSVTKELSVAENQARLFFNTSKQGTKEIAQEAVILAKVFDKDVNEVLRSANVLSKQFGLSGEASLELINKGFEKGGDVSGELLDNISEYSTQLRLAGLNAEESISIITQSQQQGVFSDKGIDAIKEATLSLREMTPPAKEALEAIGMSAEQVQKDIASGTKTYFDVIQEISSKTNEVGEKSQAAGMILADVFKGAGEDAGDFIFSLGEMNTSLEELEDQNKGVEGAIQNLTREFYELVFGVEDAVGVNEKFAAIINFVANNLSTILGLVARAGAAYLVYANRVKIAKLEQFLFGGGLIKTIRNIPNMIRGLKGASFSFKNLGKSMKGIPFVTIIALITELVSWLWDTSEATDAATQAEKDLSAAYAEGNRLRAERLSQDKTIEEQVKIANSLSQVQLKLLKDKIESSIAESEANDLSIKTSKEVIEANKKEDAQRQKVIDGLRKKRTALILDNDASLDEIETLGDKIRRLEDEDVRIKENQKLRSQGLELSDDEIARQEQLNEWLSQINPLIKENTRNKDDNGDASKKAKESQDKYNKSLERSLRLQELINDIERIEVGSRVDKLAEAAEEAVNAEIEALQSGNYSIILEYQKRIDRINELIELEKQARIQNATDAYEFEKLKIEQTVEDERERALMLEKLELEHQQEINQIIEDSDNNKIESKKEIDGELQRLNEEQKAKEKRIEEEKTADLEKELEERKKMFKELQEFIASETFKQINKTLEANKKAQEEQIDLTKTQVEKQQELAEQGLDNSLAFEEEALAEQQAKLQEIEKRQERIKKIETLYDLTSSYAQSGANNPLEKALGDLAKIEAIKMTFGDGGVVEDRLPGNGVFSGPSHKHSSGGIPIMVEGQEGIFSVKEMKNLGKSNFYDLKGKLNSGPIGNELFGSDKYAFVHDVGGRTPQSDPQLLNEVRSLRKDIQKQDTLTDVKIQKAFENYIDIITETTSGNKKYTKTKRKRLTK